MRSFGKTVKLFYKDGATTGIRIAEIVNNTVQAIACSRLRLHELLELTAVNKPGVYFLLGLDSQDYKQKVYIGESENTYTRLQQQILQKDFWNDVIFFVNKDENLTKAHVRYLESRLIQEARASGRYTIENGNQSSGASLPMSDTDAMEELLTHIKILIVTLGHHFLEPPLGAIPNSSGAPMVGAMPVSDAEDNIRELSLRVSGLRAEAQQTDEGIIVIKNSQAAENVTDKLSPGYKKLRATLIENGVLKAEGAKYIFTENTLFKSASSAAAMVVGYNINGLLHWKDASGKTLSELENGSI